MDAINTVHQLFFKKSVGKELRQTDKTRCRRSSLNRNVIARNRRTMLLQLRWRLALTISLADFSALLDCRGALGAHRAATVLVPVQ